MKLIYRKPNWEKLIKEIKKITGWDNRRVSEEAKIPSYTVYALLRDSDKDVYYKTGIALANLHERVTRKEH